MRLVLTPDWFLGNDVLIELFSFFVLAIFCYICWKNYRLTNKKSFVYLGSGFLLIALSQLATILTKLVLYYDTTFTQKIGQMVITYNVVNSVDTFYDLGFFFYRFLTLAGLYLIYRLPDKKQTIEELFLFFYFIVLSSVVGSGFYYLFHLTSFLFLILIIRNYYRVYSKNKSGNTLILIIAFTMLSFSQFLFIMGKIESIFIIANFIELVSYIILVILIFKILRYHKQDGKKKK